MELKKEIKEIGAISGLALLLSGFLAAIVCF